ncbi:MAG: PilZ domain-containing protein [Archangiaceae bacterium]|nr:PilZ domain-containing protein [Archangiaceae bacterium]
MDPSEWMAGFRITHEKAKAKKLTDSEHKAYLEMREELARSLVAAQAMTLPEGQNSRKHFRVAQMYKIEISNTYQTMTKQVSRSGFSCTLTSQLPVGQVVPFSLMLGREGEPVTGQAKVVSAVKQGGWVVAFSIDHISEANGERLESALFDAVLSRFK